MRTDELVANGILSRLVEIMVLSSYPVVQQYAFRLLHNIAMMSGVYVQKIQALNPMVTIDKVCYD